MAHAVQVRLDHDARQLRELAKRSGYADQARRLLALAAPAGEPKGEALKFDFDRRLKRRFRGFVIASDNGSRAYRELDDAVAGTFRRR